MKSVLVLVVLAMMTMEVASQDLYNSLKSIKQTHQLVEFFNGMFGSIGVVMEDNVQSVTIEQRGKEIAIKKGIDSSEVDFILKLTIKNLKDFEGQSSDGIIDSEEATKILRVFFTPMTIATLNHPVLKSNSNRKLAGIEDLMHVYLLFPDNSVADTHTLLYTSGEWKVIEGTHGTAKRIFWLNAEDAIVYQRKIFKAVSRDTKKEWKAFLKWYKKWRKSVSTTNS